MRILTDRVAPPAPLRPAVQSQQAPAPAAEACHGGPDSSELSAPTADEPAEGPRALPLAQRVGMAGMAALSLFGALLAGAANAEAGTREVPSASRTMEKPSPSPTATDQWLLSGGSPVDRWAAPFSSAPRRIPGGPPEVLTMKDLPPPTPEPRPLPSISKPAPAQKGDYVKHGVNFSHLLTDAEFEDSKALGAGQIQELLDHMDSFLADYRIDGESAAQMVARISDENKVNPWLLLATLEKESSMVTRAKAPPKARLNAAMGYGYHDGGGKPRKSNLAFQLEKGAELLRELYDDAKAEQFPKTIKVDYGKRSLKVRNAATLALMRYTPHTVDTKLERLGGGNYLFRRQFERFQARFMEMVRTHDGVNM